MMSVSKLILKKIKIYKYEAFTSADFLELGSYKSISKALESLEDDKIIARAMRGVYYPYKVNKFFGFVEPPNINAVAEAIARQYNYNFVPSKNYALNIIGISNQVPSTYTFISSGPYKSYKVGMAKIDFKHGTSKEVNGLRYKNLLAIQAIKALGINNINSEVKSRIDNFLDEDDKIELRNNNIKITARIYNVLIDIIGSKNNV